MASVQETIDEFRARPKNQRCKDVCKALRQLGFDVRAGDGPGHKVVGHPKLTAFHGTNFNCGHGKNPDVNAQYVKALAGVLERWKTEIEELQK